jgi:hypothetical protein
MTVNKTETHCGKQYNKEYRKIKNSYIDGIHSNPNYTSNRMQNPGMAGGRGIWLFPQV